MSADPQNRQFQQLNTFRKERATVHVYLLSGTRFTGRIRSFDVHTVLLETQSGDMVIYGHAISTIEPAPMGRGRRPGPVAGGRLRPGVEEPTAPPRSAGLPQQGPVVAGVRQALRSDEAPEGAPQQDMLLPRSGPVAPAVTIVRRRSRLVPKPEGA